MNEAYDKMLSTGALPEALSFAIAPFSLLQPAKHPKYTKNISRNSP